MRICFVLFLCLKSILSYSQSVSDTLKDEKTFSIVEVEKAPEFPGGGNELAQYLADIPIPEELIISGINEEIWVSFVVDSSGHVQDITIKKGSTNNLLIDEIALDHINRMPKWKPGIQKGKPVRVQYVVPIKFRFD